MARQNLMLAGYNAILYKSLASSTRNNKTINCYLSACELSRSEKNPAMCFLARKRRCSCAIPGVRVRGVFFSG